MHQRQPVFLFSREQHFDAINPLLLARTSTDNIVSDPSVDFDRLLIELQSDLRPRADFLMRVRQGESRSFGQRASCYIQPWIPELWCL